MTEEEKFRFYLLVQAHYTVVRGWEPAAEQMIREIEEFLAKEATGRG